jgi:hypothetical protein
VIDRYTVSWDLPVREEWFDEHGFCSPLSIPQRQHVRDLLDVPVAIVSGEPWIGKTHVSKQLHEGIRQRRKFVYRLSLEEGDSPARSPWWEHWRSSPDEAWFVEGEIGAARRRVPTGCSPPASVRQGRSRRSFDAAATS